MERATLTESGRIGRRAGGRNCASTLGFDQQAFEHSMKITTRYNYQD